MAKHRIIIALVAGFITHQAIVSAYYDPQRSGIWSGFVEALYWKPTHGSIRWASTNVEIESNGPTDEIFDLQYEQDYSWGFRLGGQCDIDCVTLRLSYRWLTAHKRLFQPAFGNAFQIIGSNAANSTFADGSFFWRYQSEVGELGFAVIRSCKTLMNIYGVARWSQIDFTYDIFGPDQLDVTDVIESRYQSRFSGGGPGIAFEVCHHLFCGLRGFGRLGATALIGPIRRKRLSAGIAVNGGGSVANPVENTHIAPFYEVDLGLRYQWHCSCVGIGARVGYALEYYSDAMRYPVTDALNALVTDDPCYNVGVGGFYFGIDCAY